MCLLLPIPAVVYEIVYPGTWYQYQHSYPGGGLLGAHKMYQVPASCGHSGIKITATCWYPGWYRYLVP